MADILERLNSANVQNIADALDTVASRTTVAPIVTSISSQAAKSTYYFPVLTSKNVSQKTATLIATNLETVYAYFMRACFALTPAIRVNGDVNVEEYLKKFHQNIGISNNKFGIVLREEEMAEFKLLPNEPLNESVRTDRIADHIQNAAFTADDMIDRGNEVKNDIKDAVAEYKKLCQKADAYWTTGAADKKNAMAPSVMPVTCEFISDKKGSKGDSIKIAVQIPVGIKTVIHPCDPEETVDRLCDALSGHGVVKSLIRWSSGEVESLGDMLFSTKQMKKNISGDSTLDRWFDVIEKRSRINKLSLGIMAKKPFLPNMSIVISIDDVNEIERRTKMNLLKDPKHAARLIKECFLLGLIITDDVYETAYVMYDGHSDFDEVPYSTVKRETDKTMDMMSDLIKVMNK